MKPPQLGEASDSGAPSIVVLSSLFPRPTQPYAGIFIRERMLRVSERLPLVVIAPIPWFPFQSILRRWRPHFRPHVDYYAKDRGVEVHSPRFLSIPFFFKSMDGLSMALGSYRTCRRLKKEGRADLIDAHFVYPDGYAACCLGSWLRVPFTVTARGTESRLARSPILRSLMGRVVRAASHLFAVSSSLKEILLSLGAPESNVTVVGNGVDIEKFYPVNKLAARAKLGLPADARVLISVGGLVERKGFHRVIECLPDLVERFPKLVYVVVGSGGPEGDWGPRLRTQIKQLNLDRHVVFTGSVPAGEMKEPLSAADIFVLATRNEGWANVFLEAMACGLPVVTTDVGGNREVVRGSRVGVVVPFGDQKALENAIEESLVREWDRAEIIEYARRHDWDSRASVLIARFEEIIRGELHRSPRVR